MAAALAVMFVLVMVVMVVVMLALLRFLVPAAVVLGSLEKRTELPGSLSLHTASAVTVTVGSRGRGRRGR